MPVRDLLIALLLIALVLVAAFGLDAAGLEYYLFLPDFSLRRGWDGPHPPPTSPWFVLYLVALPTAVFFLSRRYAAIFFAILPLLALLGLPAGPLIFDWTPGIGQYLMIACLGGLAALIWTNSNLHED